MNRYMTLRAKVEGWAQARNEAPEEHLHRIDANGAEGCGCHVLAELVRLRERLEKAQGPLSGAEVVMLLAPIVALARGEAQDRLRRETGDGSLEVPGIVAHKTGGVS